MSNACKTLVTITAPPAKMTSSTLAMPMLPPPTSISTLTIASVPPTLLLEPGTAAVMGSGSVSAATTPVDGGGQSKLSSLALTPPSSTTTLGGVRTAPSAQQHHVTFMPLMSMMKPGLRVSALGSPTTATASAPSLIEPETVVVRPRTEHQQQHRTLELRQSVQSQVTTVEDVDYDDTDSDDDDDDGVDGAPPFGEAQVVGVIELEPTPNSGPGSSSSSPDK